MIAELGHFSLILALCVAIILSVVPMVGSFTGTYSWIFLRSFDLLIFST